MTFIIFFLLIYLFGFRSFFTVRSVSTLIILVNFLIMNCDYYSFGFQIPLQNYALFSKLARVSCFIVFHILKKQLLQV